MTTIDDEVDDLAGSIWETLFEPDLVLAPDGVGNGARPTDQDVSAVVQVTGSWHGAIMLQLPMALARTLTAAMFQSPGDPTADEITDAVGELTNMLAGNIKALLPMPSVISLPAVAFGSDYALSVVGTRPLSSRHYRCAGQPLAVTVMQRSGEDGGAS